VWFDGVNKEISVSLTTFIQDKKEAKNLDKQKQEFWISTYSALTGYTFDLRQQWLPCT
jgi:hypothetical protein